MRIILLTFFTSLLLSSCTLLDRFDNIDGPDTNPKTCDENVVVDSDKYLNGPKDYHVIENVSVDGDCLEITFASSGCSGSSWVYELVDADLIMESYPIQRNIRLSLKNTEMCEAFITKTVSFDVSALKAGNEVVILHLDGYDESIRIE